MVTGRIGNFPFEIRDVDHETNEQLKKNYTGQLAGFVEVGPKKYFFSKVYEKKVADIYNFQVRPDDTFVISFPRSGTTWTQELVWLIKNDLDFAKAQSPLESRFPFLEFSTLDADFLARNFDEMKDLKAVGAYKQQLPPAYEELSKLPSPRFIKSHLPLSLLPPKILDTCKVVFVARNPLDVAVSYYHHNRLFKLVGFKGDFKTYWNCFVKGQVFWAPFFETIKEAWEKRNHPNMLFLFYEDMVKDLPATIRSVSDFFGKSYSKEQVEKLCEHLHIDNFKENTFVNGDSFGEFMNPEAGSFIQKGKSGGWREYFDEEMTAQAQRWIADNLADTDLRFPTINDLLLPTAIHPIT